jgi:anti-sigma factor RsiW
MDRMMRFGRALFAVPKDELPKRAERKKAPRKKRTPKPEPS